MIFGIARGASFVLVFPHGNRTRLLQLRLNDHLVDSNACGLLGSLVRSVQNDAAGCR